MRVLLTGASGFIGSHVAAALVERHHDVAAVVRPESSAETVDALSSRGAEVFEADLADARAAATAVERAEPEALLHAAWYVEPGRYLHAVRENLQSVEMSTRLVRACLDAGAGRVVLVGTGFEPDAGGAEGGVQPPQRSIYAQAKAAMHALAAGLHTEGVAATCAHVFYLYGPGESPERLVPLLIRSALAGEVIEVTDGRQRRDYLHVTDVAAGLVTVLENETPAALDVCAGDPIEVRALYDAVGGVTGRRELIRDGARPYGDKEVVRAAGDASELVSLGWKANVPLRDGIVECVEWWRDRSSR